MSTEAFHFLRPGWLLALALLAPLTWFALRRRASAGAWRRVCDPELLPHLLLEGSSRGTRLPLALFALGWAAACVALAGPTWERLPVPAYQTPVQTVVALELAASMDARDISPTRATRARYELLDLLDRVEGTVGLVIFAEEPYAVTPLTDDPAVVAAQVPILEPALMPGRGARVDRALDEARVLLDRAGATRGRIVLLGDGPGDDPTAAERAAVRAADAGFPVSILGVGGDAEGLETLAGAGGGVYAPIAADDRDVERVLSVGGAAPGPLGSLGESSLETDAWRDMGAWLVLLPLALAPLAFRRGWVAPLALFAVVGADAPVARADGLGDWIARPDQQGARAFEEGRHDRAAELFADPAWRAASLYRAGDHRGAAEALAGLDDPRSHYNRGNALAQAGRLEEAIASYDAALDTEPDNADAAHNRAIVQELLDRQSEPPPQGESEDPGDSGSDGAEGESDAESGEDEASEGDGSEPAGSERAGSEPAGSEPGDSEGRDSQRGDSDGAGDDATAAGTEGTDAAGEGSPEPSGSSSSDAGTDTAAEDSRRAAFRDAASAEASDHAGAGAAPDPGEVRDEPGVDTPPTTAAAPGGPELSEEDQEAEQWLRRVPDDPAGLLREKLRRRYTERRYGARSGGVR